MYGRDLGGQYNVMQSTCLYSSKPAPLTDPFAQSMSVVEPLMDCSGGHGHCPVSTGPPSCAFDPVMSLPAGTQMTNTYMGHHFPHPYQGLHHHHQQQVQQLAAHRQEPKRQTSKPALHFPWMKTTKSHAHQWKANWPGNFPSVLHLTTLLPFYNFVQ